LKQRDGKDAALVAFVSPAEKQWRFSYVKMEYATVEKDSGKIGVETKLTPARRFSYIVGEGESCHTAQTRFLGLLQDTETTPTLAQVEEAFSVEAVTKEFFKKYAELFGEIQKALDKVARKDPAIAKEFDKKSVRTADFAKKLMGQIVFLYFIQKKGWLGVEKGKDWGSGPHDFLRRLARGDYGKYENFFNDILEPLFYSTLAEDRGHEAWCKRFNCRIPFLNGGLFEPLAEYDWRKTEIVLPNLLFTNDERLDDISTDTGLLDMFDRYNFTVNEAEPLEKEVAIDPEMLGKVFENLIEENLRKGLGSYCTPREIVHYMCQESMINYLDTALNSASETIGREKRKQAEFDDEKSEQTLLAAPTRHEVALRADIETFVHLGDQISHYESVDTRYAIKMPKSIEKHARLIDEKLADITICDPAVGSGAFPVGLMSEIVRARSALTPYFNDVRERTPYHFKRHAIHNCLYGVDIDPGAIEIAKLRLWLSLVVDEEDVKQIKPLPNLDYKLVTGNSLLGFPFRSQRLQEVERLKDRFFEEVDHDRKAELKAEIHRKLQECFASSKRSLGYDVDFDFRIYFSEVFDSKGGFDCVIANPPYIDSETMTREDPELRQAVQRSYSFTKGNWDIYIAFYEKGFDLLQRSAAISYITPYKLI
jgi:type I restriction-modification system DNA methylase subunit